MEYHPCGRVCPPGSPTNSSEEGGGPRLGGPGPAAAVPRADHTRPPFSSRTMRRTFFQRWRRGDGPDALFSRTSTSPLTCVRSRAPLPRVLLVTREQKQAKGRARSTVAGKPPSTEAQSPPRFAVTNTRSRRGRRRRRHRPAHRRHQRREIGTAWGRAARPLGRGGAAPCPCRSGGARLQVTTRAATPRKGPAMGAASAPVEGVGKEAAVRTAGSSERPEPSPAGRARPRTRGARVGDLPHQGSELQETVERLRSVRGAELESIGGFRTTCL